MQSSNGIGGGFIAPAAVCGIVVDITLRIAPHFIEVQVRHHDSELQMKLEAYWPQGRTVFFNHHIAMMFEMLENVVLIQLIICIYPYYEWNVGLCTARKKKAQAIYPRPQAGALRPIVHGQTIKYNLKKRLGRGFTFEELKAS